MTNFQYFQFQFLEKEPADSRFPMNPANPPTNKQRRKREQNANTGETGKGKQIVVVVIMIMIDRSVNP